MPSDTFYIPLGVIGFPLLMTGVVISTSYIQETAESPIGSWLMLFGAMMLLVLAGGAFIDLRKRYRDWRIEERQEELARKKREMKLEEKEQQFQKEKSSKKTKTSSSTDDSESKLGKIFGDGFDETETKPDEPIFGTAKPIPDSLKQGEETTEEKKESTLDNEVYRKAIDDSLSLKSLWVIHKEPDTYRNISELYDSFNEDVHRKPDLYEIFKKEEFQKLIGNLEDRKKTEGFCLSSLGERLIEQAKKERFSHGMNF